MAGVESFAEVKRIGQTAGSLADQKMAGHKAENLLAEGIFGHAADRGDLKAGCGAVFAADMVGDFVAVVCPAVNHLLIAGDCLDAVPHTVAAGLDPVEICTGEHCLELGAVLHSCCLQACRSPVQTIFEICQVSAAACHLTI